MLLIEVYNFRNKEKVMALFIGGPADGWRIDVDTNRQLVPIPINPHPPAFTPDKAVLNAEVVPTYIYRKEVLTCGVETYYVYVPQNWNCADITEALIMGYKPEKDKERLRYIRTAEGQIYDNDDRITTGRPYKI
jgi:hypothetical protein